MDPVTQGLLGATFAQTLSTKQLGKKALIIGAVTAMAPDLDVLYGDKTLNFLKYHRGYTHALLPGALAGVLLGVGLFLLFNRFGTKRAARKPYHTLPQMLKDTFPWIILCVVAITTHPILDWFTSYGTQLGLPFLDRRYALDAVAVIDPLYSVILLVSLILGWRALSANDPAQGARRATRVGAGALALSTLYLIFGLYINQALIARAEKTLPEGVSVSCYPLLLQPFYRVLVAQTARDKDVHGFYQQTTYISYASFLAPRRPMRWSVHKDRNAYTIADFGKIGRVFHWFTGGVMRIVTEETQAQATTVALYDMRYPNLLYPGKSLWKLQANFLHGLRTAEPQLIFTRYGGETASPDKAHDLKRALGYLMMGAWTGDHRPGCETK